MVKPKIKFRTEAEAIAHLKSLGCQYIIRVNGVIPKSLDEPRSNLVRAYNALKNKGCTYVTYAAGPRIGKYASSGYKLVVGGK